MINKYYILVVQLSPIQYIFVKVRVMSCQSIENRIRLPKKHNANQNGSLFQGIKAEEVEGIVAPILVEKTNDLVHELNKAFEVYEAPKTFVFTFPDSIFPDVPPGQENHITYEQKIIVEQQNTFKDKLSEEQLSEIKEKGSFQVKSNIEYITLPYVWKINESLFWGSERREIVWNKSMARVFGILYEAKNAFLIKIPGYLSTLKRIPSKIFRLLFGAKSLNTLVNADYQRQVFKDFWKKIIDEQYAISKEWASALWSFLYVYHDPELKKSLKNEKQEEERLKKLKRQQHLVQQSQKRLSIIEDQHNAFTTQWAKMRKKVFFDLSNQMSSDKSSIKSNQGMRSLLNQSQEDLLINENQSKKDEQILQKLSEKRFTLYIDHFQTKLPKKDIPLDIINAIVFLLRLFRIIRKRYDKYEKQLQQQRRKIQIRIKKKHPIKSQYYPFFSILVESEFSKIEKIIKEQLFQGFKKDEGLNKLLHKGQIQAYIEYNRVRVNYDALIQSKKKELPEYHEPSRIFYSDYKLLPPYQLIKHDQNDYVWYSLKTKSDFLTVSTETNFWKLKLYAMRVKTWTYNSLVGLVGLAWKGPFGLRCLYGVADFSFDMYLPDNQKPEIEFQYNTTVIGRFYKVLQGIAESRRNFEQTPDLGLLGKKISRYFNYLQCYVFRLIIVGVLLVLILYPISIIVFSCLAIIFVFTFWAWMPVSLALCYLFNVLVYQFQTSYQSGYRSLPLVRPVFIVIRVIIICLLITLNLIILAPVKSLFLFLFYVLQKGFRITLDGLMLLIFTKVGRTPSRDTSIAKKISGPGMSKEFYMSINQEDVYVLMRARLQLIYLQKFNELIQQKINQNHVKAKEIQNHILKCFFPHNYNTDIVIISYNAAQLMHNYNDAYYKHKARYPRNPWRVRFTQEEIDNYFDNTVTIVKNFVVKHEIEKFIFDQYHLYEDMYDDLTRDLWKEIFGVGQQIFQPLEKLDMRFKLQDQYEMDEGFNQSMKKNVRKVMESLEGEVVLSHHHEKRTAPFKHNLLNRQRNSQEIMEITNMWRSNSGQNVSLNLHQIRTIFAPNLNINEIIAIDKYAREQSIKANPTIVDL